MVTGSHISRFSSAAHQMAADGPVEDWVSSGNVNAVLQKNGLLDIYLGKDMGLLTIDTNAGLVGSPAQTTPTQWSNSDAEIGTFINRADRTATFGKGSSSDSLDIHTTGSGASTFIRYGQTLDNGVLISRTREGGLGIAIYDERVGLRSAEIIPPQAVPAPRRDIDNALAHAPI